MFKWILSLFRKKPSVKPQKIPSVEPSNDHYDEIFPDISHWNHCDFSKFKGKNLILKASDGSSRVDPEFYDNLKNCITKKINFGAYHFYRTGPDPVAQAKLFIKTVGLENMKNMYHLPIVDFESVSGKNIGQTQTNQDLRDDLDDLYAFGKYMFEQTGRKSRIYSGRYAFDKMNFPVKFLEYFDNPWIADYGKNQPTNSAPWPKIWAWQFTSNYNFEGLKGVDANKFL